MQDITHNRLMWHLGVVGVSVINRIIFPFTDICRKRLTMVFFIRCRFLRFPFCNKIANPRIRAGRVIGRITKI